MTGNELHKLQGHNGFVLTCCFNPQTTVAATGSWDRTVKLWDVNKEALSHNLELHTETQTYIEFDTTVEKLITSAYDNRAIFYYQFYKLDLGCEIRKSNSQIRITYIRFICWKI